MKASSLFFPLRHKMATVVFFLLSNMTCAFTQSDVISATGRWVGTWATAPQPCVESNMPYDNNLSNRSVRQVVKVSIGGDLMRLRLSNEYGTEPVRIKSVYIASPQDSCDIIPSTAKYLRFSNSQEVVIAPGKAVTSDAQKYELKPLQRLTITINYTSAPKLPTVHPGARTTSYIMKGACNPHGKFKTAERHNHWYNIAAIDVYDTQSSAIAIIGNSITDGKNSTDNGQNRWPDMLSEFLQLKHKVTHLGILNLGIGGNQVVIPGGNGDIAIERFDRDVLQQQGVGKVVIFEGVNDIGTSKGNCEEVAERLIKAFEEMTRKAKARNQKVYLATITPFEGSFYYTIFHEAAREYVNEWIRKQKGKVDGIIDFDALVRDPVNPHRLREEFQSDWLHLNPAGYKEMGLYAAEILK